MRRLLSAELYWLRHRRAIWVGAGAGVAVLMAVVIDSAIGSSSDVAGAIARAEALAKSASESGFDLPVAGAYIEPRYLLGVDLPNSLAQISLGLALVGLVVASLSIGGEWRGRTVHLSFTSARERVRPILLRVGTWVAAWAMVSVIALAIAVLCLGAVARAAGDPNGISYLAIAGFVMRGAIVCAVGALVGAAWAAATRSNTFVVVAVIAYLLLFEIVLRVLTVGTTARTPATMLHQFVTARVIESGHVPDCGAPRCEEVYATHFGSWIAFAVLLLIATISVVATVVGARRNVLR